MRRERVILLRSGRHLTVAIDALRERFPDCEIAVVGTPGSEPVIAQAGIWTDRIFIYSARPRFTPLAFSCSRTGFQARAWRFTRVAVLWNDPNGHGQGNVDRTAFALAPRGFLAVTPDGSIVERAPFPMAGVEARRAMTSVKVGAVLAALFIPAVAIGLVRTAIKRLKPRVRLPAKAGSHSGTLAGSHSGAMPGSHIDSDPRWLPASAGRSADAKDEAA